MMNDCFSKYLPEDFDSSKVIVLIAGQGDYPMIMANKIRSYGLSLKLIGFEGETEGRLIDSFGEKDRIIVKVGQLGRFLKGLKQLEAKYTIMAGQITPRKLFKGLHLDLKAMLLLATLKVRNAETIFGLLIREIQKNGMLQLDARAFIDDELACEGVMVGKVKVLQEHIQHAIDMAQSVARLNIGQGVVCSKGTVLAVEAFEGTDVMLRRAGGFGAKDMIFVKTIKSDQDFRLDVPVFGIKTIEALKEAGINMVFLEAYKTIILDKKRVLEAAKREDITIVGYIL